MTTLDQQQAESFNKLIQSFGVANALSAYRDNKLNRALGEAQ